MNSSHATFESTCIHVRASFGVIAYGAGDAPEILIQQADAAMFANKKVNRSGRTRAMGQLATP